MSLTSYRAAPSRAMGATGGRLTCEWVFADLRFARAAMPGDDLLFHRLSDSTIGAVWFHGRVRDGIGWFTDAIATRQWSPCDGQPGLPFGRKSGFQIDTVHTGLNKAATGSSDQNVSQSCH